MAVATVGRRKKQREVADAAARQRRSRVMLIGLSVLLLIVAVVEVPKTLSKLHGSSTAAEPVTVDSSANATQSQVAAAVRAKLALIDRRFPVKDPFVAQLGQSSATVANLPPFATAPPVKASHFAAKDPFKAQVGLAAGEAVQAVPAIATPPAVSSGKKSRVSTKAPTSGYIVVLRSLGSKSAGLSELRRAHANGFPSAELLFSSKYTTLRRGYWVVYVPYPNTQGANAGTQRAHGHGYPSAYRRVAKP